MKDHLRGKKHRRRRSLRAERSSQQLRSLFVSGFARGTAAEDLKEHFAAFGEVQAVVVDKEKVAAPFPPPFLGFSPFSPFFLYFSFFNLPFFLPVNYRSPFCSLNDYFSLFGFILFFLSLCSLRIIDPDPSFFSPFLTLFPSPLFFPPPPGCLRHRGAPGCRGKGARFGPAPPPPPRAPPPRAAKGAEGIQWWNFGPGGPGGDGHGAGADGEGAAQRG